MCQKRHPNLQLQWLTMNIKSNKKLNRNILEIEVEKVNVEDEVIVSEETVVNILCKTNMIVWIDWVVLLAEIILR